MVDICDVSRERDQDGWRKDSGTDGIKVELLDYSHFYSALFEALGEASSLSLCSFLVLFQIDHDVK